MTYSIAELIKTISKNHDALWKYQLLQQWPLIIGDLQANISLQKVTNDSVILGVNDSCWLAELYHLSPLLLDLINKSLEKPHIKKIQFRLVSRKEIQVQEKKNSNVTAINPSRPIDLTNKEKLAVGVVTDNDLKSLLIQYRIRCQKKA